MVPKSLVFFFLKRTYLLHNFTSLIINKFVYEFYSSYHNNFKRSFSESQALSLICLKYLKVQLPPRWTKRGSFDTNFITTFRIIIHADYLSSKQGTWQQPAAIRDAISRPGMAKIQGPMTLLLDTISYFVLDCVAGSLIRLSDTISNYWLLGCSVTIVD